MGMVDITSKDESYRFAVASGRIKLKHSTMEAIKKGVVPKGDPLSVALVAAISAGKNTYNILPFCHQIPITEIKLIPTIDDNGVTVKAEVKSTGKTGVEMEALVSTAVYLLTLWDMVKPLEKDDHGQYPSTAIEWIRVEKKIKKMRS
jgi:cyclic pyranopterin phosphate synthase